VTDPNELEYRERLQRALGPDYTLGELIGRGGFGSVYKAVDRKLDREVAVKALRHDLFPTPLVLERFEREAKAVAKLRHANILPVYAVGAGEGVAYMIMPVIHGSNLQALTSGGKRVDPATTVRIISEVARALEAAH
jgi:eukaryotic-like serine/threonine-protein kinase